MFDTWESHEVAQGGGDGTPQWTAIAHEAGTAQPRAVQCTRVLLHQHSRLHVG